VAVQELREAEHLVEELLLSLWHAVARLRCAACRCVGVHGVHPDPATGVAAGPVDEQYVHRLRLPEGQLHVHEHGVSPRRAGDNFVTPPIKSVTVVEVSDGQLGLYINDQLIVESEDGILIDIASKLCDEDIVADYHYVHRPDYELDPLPDSLQDIFIMDLERD
jgi:hypothetical protein